jgi:hypothetical protein
MPRRARQEARRGHGWEAVADYALEWANRPTGAPARMEERARV